MKKPICFVVSSVMTVNAFLQEPIKFLSKSYKVYVAVNGSFDTLSPSLKDIVTVLPVVIERKVSFWHDLVALFQLFFLFRKYNFKSVHSVTPKAGLLAMLAAFLGGINIRTHTFTGQVWVTRRDIKRWFLKCMDRLIVLWANYILVDSASQRQFLLNERVITTDKSSVLADGSISGVDVDRFKPDRDIRFKIRRELNISNEDVVLLFIGRLNRDKGVLDLASAFAGVSVPQVSLLIVGSDEEKIRPEMERLLSGCINSVKFVGFSSNPEDYMKASDVLCLPSYREGFGSVIIEAAAVGIPAIGSRIYGVVDAIVEGKTGLLFEAKNVDELRECIMTLSANNTLRMQYGKQARERALERFSSLILAEAWLEYYQERL